MTGEAPVRGVAERQFLDALGAEPARSEPSWLAELRRDAAEHFREVGLPTTRNEDWRYTPLGEVAKTPFIHAAAEGHDRVDLAALHVPDFGGDRCVFINGHWNAALSGLRSPSETLQIRPLARAIAEEARDPQGRLCHLGRLLDVKADGLAALNTAWLTDGAVIEIAPGARIDRPIQLIFVSTAMADVSRACFPRLVVLAGANSQAVVVQDHVSSGGGSSLTCSVSEIAVESDASLTWLLSEREGHTASHLSLQRVAQNRASAFSQHTFCLGGSLTRNDLEIALCEERAAVDLHGLFLGRGTEIVDNHTLVDHRVPHCASSELYKGVVGDRARGIFRGCVIVRPDAQHTEASQQNKNLILGGSAEIDAKPQLEIYADDVQCSHGSSTGQLSEDALFFLRSRGLSEREAKALLIEGFANEMSEAIADESARNWIGDLVRRRLDDLTDGGASR